MKNEHEYEFLRFTLNQRIQHFVLLTAFIALVITGMPLKYPDTWWAPRIVDLLGGAEMRALIHRIAGVTMVALGIYHVVYYLLIKRSVMLHPRLTILPTIQDIKDFFHVLKYYFGLEKGEPKYGRYSWKEKFDYWGAFWGMCIMCITGPMPWVFG